ncbi:Wzz/FepE/Etk N-terminal domain-containing protein [Salimicrobium sp. PL1-032A]|uniref:YveK family protein n=1 Tax=Salimicrobium sp. PL1-032A TaxID=3095364 RepID=UPI0032603824
MEETISLKEIADVLKKRWKLIAGFMLAALLVSALVTFFALTPTYQNSSQFIVSQGESETSEQSAYDINEIRSNVELINTYNVIIKSPAILDRVNDELGLDMSAGQLADKLQVSNAEQSQVVDVQATDESPQLATDLANVTVQTFKDEIPDLMNVDNVNILSEATVGEEPSPISPNTMLNLAIAVVVGLMLGVGVAFLLEYLDTTVKNTDDVEELFGHPVMGTISTIDPSEAAPQEEPGTYRKATAIDQRRENVGS